MCVVSMIGDHYRDVFGKRHWIRPLMPDNIPWQISCPPEKTKGKEEQYELLTRAEFEALRKEVEDMKALLKRAKEYDERNEEPDCETDDKMDLLRRVAKLVGVDLDDVIGAAK